MCACGHDWSSRGHSTRSRGWMDGHRVAAHRDDDDDDDDDANARCVRGARGEVGF